MGRDWTEAIDAGRIVSAEEVYIELERQEGDALFHWVRDRRARLIVPLEPDVQACVTEIGAAFQSFVSGDGDRNLADPWVIGVAMTRRLTVVTPETRPGSPDSPTIPRVCRHFDVPFLSTFEFMRNEGWQF